MSTITTVKASVTRKVGPLPAWAWLALIAGSYLVYHHYRQVAASTPQAQFSPAVGAASPANTATAAGDEGAASGGGPGMPELPSDLLAQFFSRQAATIDALTSAVAGTSAVAAAPSEAGAPQGAAASAGPASDPTPGIDPASAVASVGAKTGAAIAKWLGIAPAEEVPGPIEDAAGTAAAGLGAVARYRASQPAAWGPGGPGWREQQGLVNPHTTQQVSYPAASTTISMPASTYDNYTVPSYVAPTPVVRTGTAQPV